MSEIWGLLGEAFRENFANFNILTVIDLLLVTYTIFVAMKLLRHTRALSLIKGLVMLVLILEFSSLLGLRVTNYLLSSTLQVGVIAIIIIFQPELRRALDQIGRKAFMFDFSSPQTRQTAGGEELATAVCDAVEIMSSKKIGAIIVLERVGKLGEYTQSGTVVDAKVSSATLLSLFYPGSAMHDGAVVIRQGRIYAAGCFLPLTVNNDISKELGTRHRAALGLSENSDAFVIVVSEETGTVSTAEDGVLTRGYRTAELRRAIIERFGEEVNSRFSLRRKKGEDK